MGFILRNLPELEKVAHILSHLDLSFLLLIFLLEALVLIYR